MLNKYKLFPLRSLIIAGKNCQLTHFQDPREKDMFACDAHLMRCLASNIHSSFHNRNIDKEKFDHRLH